MTDPADVTHVGDALLAWAQRTFGGTTSVVDGPHPVTGGLDTFIYRFRLGGPVEGMVAGPLILRLYPSAERGPSARREAEVLRFLAGAGYRAPHPIEASAATDDFGVPYVVMEQVAGETVLDRVASAPRQAPALIDALAAAHARLHRVETAGWPLDAHPGTWEVDRRLAAAGSAGPPAEADLARAWDWLRDNRVRAQGEGPAVCHYDFHPMNAIVDGAGEISVIDWEGAGVGDRHSDLARTLVLFEWAPVVASSRLERSVLRAAKPWLVKRYRAAYARHLPVDDERLRYWMALHAADGWTESLQLLSGTFARSTRTDTREGPAAIVGPAMAKLFRRLVPEA